MHYPILFCKMPSAMLSAVIGAVGLPISPTAGATSPGGGGRSAAVRAPSEESCASTAVPSTRSTRSDDSAATQIYGSEADSRRGKKRSLAEMMSAEWCQTTKTLMSSGSQSQATNSNATVVTHLWQIMGSSPGFVGGDNVPIGFGKHLHWECTSARCMTMTNNPKWQFKGLCQRCDKPLKLRRHRRA